MTIAPSRPLKHRYTIASPTRPLPLLRVLNGGTKGHVLMSRDDIRCPVLGCNKRKDKWGTKGYSLPSLDVFTLQLSPGEEVTEDTLICRRCYDRDRDHSIALDGRIRVVPGAALLPPSSPSHLDVLADYVDEVLLSTPTTSFSSSSPSPFPSFFCPSPASPPSLPSTPILYPVHHTVSAPLLPSTPLRDITNLRSPPSLPPKKKRRLSPNMGDKEEVVRALSVVPRGQRTAVMNALGVSSSDVYNYKKSIQNDRSKPKGQQRPKSMCRAAGGGRDPKLSEAQEAEVKQYVLSLRRSPARPRVTRVMVSMYIQSKYGIQLGRKGIAGLMARQRLSERKRTTTKEVNTPRMREIKFHWTNKFAPFFADTDHRWIINIDETSVYRDAPGDRTIDEVGAKTVEIGTTQHDADRVAVLLCINRAGTMFTPLIIHKSTSKKKVLQFFPTTVKVKKNDREVDVKMWVTYAPKGWLNGAMMIQWLQLVYMDELASRGISLDNAVLFMDNCPAHDHEDVLKAMKESGVKHVFFPPKCTPILQPLDQNVNQLFGLCYAQQWERWYMTEGCYDFTPAHNLRRAKDEEVNRWIAHALVDINPHIVRVSWERSISAPRHVLRLPPRPWATILSFLSPAAGPVLTAWRSKYDGSRFVFPVRQRRKKKPTAEEEEIDRGDDGDDEAQAERDGEWDDEEEVEEDEVEGSTLTSFLQYHDQAVRTEEARREEEWQREEQMRSAPGQIRLQLHPNFSSMMM